MRPGTAIPGFRPTARSPPSQAEEANVFGSRFSSSIGLLGVDIGSRSIKLLQLSASRGGDQSASTTAETLAVVGAGEVEQERIETQADDPDSSEPDGTYTTSAESSTARMLRTAFASGRFTGRRCVVSLPRSDVRLQSVRLPKMPDSELRQAVGWEAAQRFGMSHELMEVDFIRTGATLQIGENREEVIVVAASHEAIQQRLRPIIEAGFRPVAIDTDFAALARTFSRQYRREADRQNVRAIVEIGATGSTVLILRGDQIAFCKPLDVSGQQLNEAVAEHLDMDIRAASELRLTRMTTGARDADHSHDPSTERAVYEAVRPVVNELVKEVNLCLRYFGVTFRGKPPSQIILTGGDGLEPQLAEAIERVCKVVVVHDDQTNTLTSMTDGIQRICHPGLSGAAPSRRSMSAGCWAVAAGLSLRGMAVCGQSMIGRMLSAASSHGSQKSTQVVKGAA